MRRLCILVFLLTAIVNIIFAKNAGAYKQESYISENTTSINADASTISGTITGPTAVCQGSSDQNITFTGSGSTTGYTFFYQIDGVDQPSVSATSGNTATVNISTGTAGSFVYKLVKVTDNASISTDLNQTVTVVVNALPSAEFTFPDNQCSGENVTFTPSLTGPSYSYAWNFGDGTALSTDASPTHEFLSVGCGNFPYQVTLTIMDANGCQSYKTKTISIKQKPDIEFTNVDNLFDPSSFSNCSSASASNPSYTVKLGNSSASISCITSYSIDWGDGSSTSNVVFPISHTYSQLGVFTMIVTALCTNGCTNSKQYVVKNVSNPRGAILGPGSTADLCAPTSDLQFVIADWGANSLGTTYDVDFGDQSTIHLTQEQMVASSYYLASDPNNSSNYPVPHSYKISSCPNSEFIATLTASNACKSTVSTTNSIIILTKPDANFTIPISACVNSSVLFTNTTIPGSGQNCDKKAIYTWDFGDGSSIVVTPLILPQNINHTYSASGTYTVILTATNYCGTTSKTKQLVINSLPTATILGDATICENSTPPVVTFTGAGSIAPYRFTYTVNGITKTVSTTSGNSVTIPASTSSAGVFTYTLVSVQGNSPSGCSQNQTGSATVVVNALPTATITGTTTT